MRITAQCKYFHVLPYAGGLMEQPGIAVLKMEKIIEAQAVHDKYETDKAKRRGNQRN